MSYLQFPAFARLFDTVMRPWMAAHSVPRGSIAVMCDSRLIFAAGYGGRGLNERVPIWSLSKAITALCVASLIGDKRLRLDDPIGLYLAPVFTRFGEPVDEGLKRVTVAQLLSHRGGIPRAVDDNMFAPGLVRLLREHQSSLITVEMLMPGILKARLVRDPGGAFEYTNMGYLLLGQMIEVLDGRPYEEACTRRVLAQSGIENPKLDVGWGGIMQAASGWALSGPEYLAFVRLLHDRPSRLFDREMSEFLCTSDGKWMSAERRAAYTLGVVIEGPGPTFLHSGGYNWKQDDAAGGPIDEARGTSYVLMPNGIAWFASYDGLSAGTDSQAVEELQRGLSRACEQMRPCPDIDNFAALGIGPVVG
jgi:CubicO group peptidase (beta-lactamase class C family)